jgi:acyl dehydratase
VWARSRLDLGCNTVTVEADRLARFAAALGIAGDAASSDPARCPTLPMTFIAAGEAGFALREALRGRRGYWLHVSQSFRYARALPLGVPLACAVSLTWSQSGDTDMALVVATTRMPGGETVCTSRTELATLRTLAGLAGAARPSYSARVRGGHAIAADTSMPLDAEALSRYARVSGDDNPIHLDETAAHEAGLSSTIVPGMLIMGRMAALAAELGDGARMQTLQVAFVAPLPTGSAVTSECRSSAPVPQGAPLPARLRLFAHDGHDGLVAIGSCNFTKD